MVKTSHFYYRGCEFDPWWGTKIPHEATKMPQLRASLVAQLVKKLPAVQETWVQSLVQEDPLEKEMATHSSTLVWKIL